MAKKSESESRWQVVQADLNKDRIPLNPGWADAIVCDPPYGLDLHGLEWDKGFSKRPEENGIAFDPHTWLKMLKVAKAGAYLVAFGGSRTWHRIACAIEDGGWTLRDHLYWIHDQGFPRVQTVLKPAVEPIILAQKRTTSAKPLPLQIEACRVGKLWPPNVVLDHSWHDADLKRYCFVSKPNTSEREFGCAALPRKQKAKVLGDLKAAGEGRNYHPTVKPVSLMQWLCRLVTPKRGLIYDPFTGSGTTGMAAMYEGFRFIGTEMNPEYVAIARARIKAAAATKQAQGNWEGR